MLCPYCLQTTNNTQCHNCKEPLPPLYVQQRQGGLFAKNPAVLSAVGFSGHGKTVFLAALLHSLEKQLTKVWPKFFRQGLDVESVRNVQNNLALLQKGDLPESTRRNFPRPSVHLLSDMPHFGSRGLLIYDPPGEAFDSDEGMERFAHFVKRAKVVLFLVSLVDLQEPRDADLFRLLNNYVLGMARMKAKTKDQHLVVTFTKADRLVDEFKECPHVLAHLNSADLASMANPKAHLQTLQVVSDELAHFTETHIGAVNFARLAQNQFKSVAYCAASALGSPPEEGHLATAIEPRRVADPLLWVLERSH